MLRFVLCAICIPVLGLISSSMFVAANQTGPLPGMTGGFGEQNCRTCHFGKELNEPGGSVQASGVPDAYTPGRTYPITVKLERADARKGGFELSARFGDGDSKGEQAGNKADPSGVSIWTFDWVAPAPAQGPVVFNVAANAGNGDESPLGDYIYTAETKTIAASQ